MFRVCVPMFGAAMILMGVGCTAPSPSLYERLGGDKGAPAAVTAVVDDFVPNAAKDPKVNFFRMDAQGKTPYATDAASVEKLKKHLVALILSASGGPQKYTGRSMAEVHKGMKITESEFNALAGHLINSLNKFKVPQKEQDDLIKIVAGTKPDIVGK